MNPRKYAKHAEHPRYGRAPRATGLEPRPDDPGVHLHWNTRLIAESSLRCIERTFGWRPSWPDDGTRAVSGTAVAADLAKQSPATVAVTHYLDIDKVCRDCGRRFIFFAEEQKHWYETLGFPLEAEAVRCPPCRKRMQQVGRLRRRFQRLAGLAAPNADEMLEMAECCLALVEEAVFHPRQAERVRMLLKRIPEERRGDPRVARIGERLRALGP